MNGNYRAIFVRGRTRRLICALAVAWLSFGMIALAIFLATNRATRSSEIAGVVVAAFSVGSAAFAPLRGRVLDHHGTRPWLAVLALGYAAGLLGLAASAQTTAATWVLVICAALSGASAPPLVASVRAAWPALVEEPLVRPAYALTSVVGDLGLVAAPALAGLLFVVKPWLPLIVSAVAAVASAFSIARNADHPREQEPSTPSSAPLLSRKFLVLIAVEVALGVALGLVEVAVPAAATRWRETAYSGGLLAAFAVGSVIGGIWFGRHQWKAPPDRRYLVAALLVGIALLPPVVASSPTTLAPLLLVAGLSYGPATISLFEMLDTVAVSRATEAFTWITTSAAIGTAAGNATAGWTTTNVGLWAPFVAASATLTIVAVFGLADARTSPPVAREGRGS